MTFEEIVGWASLIAALLAVVTMAWQSALSAVRQRREHNDLAQSDADNSIAADSIAAVGYLLVERLGSISISNYARNEKVRSEYRSVFNAVAEYVVPEEESDPNSNSLHLTDNDPPSVPPSKTAIAAAAYRSISEGEVWNGLARMRRAAEHVLRELVKLPATSGQGIGVGRLLSVAALEGTVSNEEASRLQEAFHIANRAIHGEDVHPPEAVSAISAIDTFLSEHEGALSSLNDESAPAPIVLSVARSPIGEWLVRSVADAQILATSQSEAEAIKTARRLLARSAEGEVRVLSPSGKAIKIDRFAHRPNPRAFELYRDASGEFRFRLRSASGQVILASTGYTSKQAALGAIELVRNLSTNANLVDQSE